MALISQIANTHLLEAAPASLYSLAPDRHHPFDGGLLRRATGWALVIIISVFPALRPLRQLCARPAFSGRAQDWADACRLNMAGPIPNGHFSGIPKWLLPRHRRSSPSSCSVTLLGNDRRLEIPLPMHPFFWGLGNGRFRGGSMKIAVVARACSDRFRVPPWPMVTATGVVTIPMIKRGTAISRAQGGERPRGRGPPPVASSCPPP